MKSKCYRILSANYGVGEQFQFPAQHHKATADIANAFAVVTAEFCNGLESVLKNKPHMNKGPTVIPRHPELPVIVLQVIQI